MATESIRVLVVDDVSRVRQGLVVTLGLAANAGTPKIDIVGEAGDGYEAIEQARVLRPDVVLMDLEMPVIDGCAAARQIKACAPSTRIIALTIYGDPESRQKARSAGMDAFLEKGAPLEEVLAAIRFHTAGSIKHP